MSNRTVVLPLIGDAESDDTASIWARQIPHLSARELQAGGFDVGYVPLFTKDQAAIHYRDVATSSADELRALMNENNADRLIMGTLHLGVEVRIDIGVWDPQGDSIVERRRLVGNRAMLLALLPVAHRHFARLCGVSLTGQPRYLAGARSEKALFALAVDLDNEDLVQANGGQLDWADPWAARFAPLIEALRRDPEFPEARQRLVERCHRSEGENRPLGLRALQQANDLVGRRQHLLLEISKFHETNKDLDAAAAIAREAVERQPGDPEARLQYGRYLLLSGHSDKARPLLAAASRLRPEDWRCAFWMARLHEDTGQRDQASPWWKRTLSLNPPDGPERRRAEQAIQRSR